MKLSTFLNYINNNLSKEDIKRDPDLIYESDETGYKIKSLEYNRETNVLCLLDEIEDK